MDLAVGSKTYALDVTANNNLTGLMNAIDSSGAVVTASISGSGPYSLSLSASGPVAMELNDNQTPVNLVSSTNQGANANFMLNGISVTKASNTVNDVVPGVSFTLANTTSGSVTLSLQQDGSQLSGALQTFVNSYNALMNQVVQQVGPSAGPLGGDMLINGVNGDIQQLATYWTPSSSGILSLSDFGVTFADNTGQLTFNPRTFAGLSSSQASDALKFPGSSSSGFAALANNFTQLTGPISGLIREQTPANAQLTNQINTLNARVSQIQASVAAQMQAADAAVAQLQSDENTVSASVQSLNYILYGKLTNANGL
jgi:flagellar hook-associated protein 2